ncbi:MAG: glycosyltransferase family 4 protein [Candidatus Andersenbacteria bacterium]|nr:glycosyltransferase family 4 protein [Candidatus Andersenbacteria bacterium]
MKVLLLAENWAPRLGGVENYLSGIVAHLPAGSTMVIAPLAGSSPDKGRLVGVSENATPHPPLVRGATIIRKRFFWPFLKPAWLPLYLSIRKLVKHARPDVVFCGKALFEGFIGLWLKQKFGIPYVIFTYAMEVEVWVKTERKKLEKVLKNADRIVYINEVTKKSLLSLGATEKQLVKIWPGINDDWFDASLHASSREAPKGAAPAIALATAGSGTDVLTKYGITGPYIFTLSRLIPRKGIDLLIDALPYVDISMQKDLQVMIAGSGPEGDALKAQAKELGIENKVKFLGRVPDEDLPALYSHAKVFALTPRREAEDIEGFGIVYLEAAACGVPSIGTLVGGIPEAVIHNQTGILVQPDNPKAIAEALALLLNNEDKRKALGEAAKKRAYDEFRWSKRIMLVKGMIDAILTRL